MQIKKFMFCASVYMLVSSIAMTGQAADKQVDKSTTPHKATTTQPQAAVPTVIEAENLSFSDLTGDLSAHGNVIVTKDVQVITTAEMRGNTKQTEIWIDGQATLQEPGTKLIGTGTHFNYTSNIGNMNDVTGKVGKQFLAGGTVDFSPEKIVAHDGTVTQCPAIVPDYHISAEKVVIWPGDKMIAYNASFWIKNVIIFTLPKYQASLKKDAPGIADAFPRIGYSNDDGVSIKQHLEYPLTNNIVAFADLWYYSHAGFKPQYGVIDREKTYSLKLVQGHYQDSDDNWIKKEPEFRFDLYSRRLGNLPVSYTFSAIYGKWTDATKTSWHQDYSLYFARDTIKLSDSLFLGLGTGVQRVKESYDGSTRDILKFDTILTKQWSPKLSTTAEYHYTKNNVSLFNYDAADLGREADIGFTYKFDQKNTVSFRQSYDLSTNKIYDQDYTWNKDLHCWQAAITYRAKRKEIKVDITTTRW